MISATFFDYIACAHSLVFMLPLVSHVNNVHLPVDVSTDVAFVRFEHEGALYSGTTQLAAVLTCRLILQM
jgi:hypothetical protein